MSTRTLCVAVTTDDGRVHESNFDIDSDTWSAFSPISTLNRPDGQNLSVSVDSPHRVATVDDSIAGELRCSFKTSGSWTPALSVATGIGLARADKDFSPTIMDLIGLGAPETAGWSFGLPMFSVQIRDAKVSKTGDATTRLDLGDLGPADLPVTFDFLGTSFLCLATESGEIYFADIPRTGKGKLTNLKTAGAGDPGKVIGVVCIDDAVCVVNDAGKIWHTSRRPDGTWRPFGDVNAATRSTEIFRQISTVSTMEFGGSRRRLHLLGVTASGGLFHTTRTLDDSPDPIWAPFTSVKAKAGDPGYVTFADFGGDNVPD